MGRPLKFSMEIEGKICSALRAGNCREKSAIFGGVSYRQFGRWMKSNVSFADAVMRAEADWQIKVIAKITEAATGTDGTRHTRTTKTVLVPHEETRADGTVIKTMRAVEEVTETVTTERNFDWRAGMALVARRDPTNWREVKQVDIRNIDDGTLVRLLESGPAEETGSGSDPAGHLEAEPE
jgi:hypothetical protein